MGNGALIYVYVRGDSGVTAGDFQAAAFASDVRTVNCFGGPLAATDTATVTTSSPSGFYHRAAKLRWVIRPRLTQGHRAQCWQALAASNSPETRRQIAGSAFSPVPRMTGLGSTDDGSIRIRNDRVQSTAG